MEVTAADEELSCELRVPFSRERDAEIAYNTLRVDPEPPRSGVTKYLQQEKNLLIVTLKAKEARRLRVAVGSFFDHLSLVVDTIREFGSDEIQT